MLFSHPLFDPFHTSPPLLYLLLFSSSFHWQSTRALAGTGRRSSTFQWEVKKRKSVLFPSTILVHPRPICFSHSSSLSSSVWIYRRRESMSVETMISLMRESVSLRPFTETPVKRWMNVEQEVCCSHRRFNRNQQFGIILSHRNKIEWFYPVESCYSSVLACHMHSHIQADTHLKDTSGLHAHTIRSTTQYTHKDVSTIPQPDPDPSGTKQHVWLRASFEHRSIMTPQLAPSQRVDVL